MLNMTIQKTSENVFKIVIELTFRLQFMRLFTPIQYYFPLEDLSQNRSLSKATNKAWDRVIKKFVISLKIGQKSQGKMVETWNDVNR